MAAITAGVCVFLSLLALFPFLLWVPGGEGEKGEHVSTSPVQWTVCLGLPPLVARYGVRRKSLDIRSSSHFGWVCADSRQWVLLCISAGFLSHFLPADSVEGEGEGEMGGGA